MANHKSALKRHRQSLEHQARNRANRTRVKNVVKAVNAALRSEDINAAKEKLVTASSVLAKAAAKGAIHWKKAARKVSRLAKAVNKAQAQTQA
ncbi:MAG: 30S ribosomal protein S20 [Desulfovibrionaceae bacterium]|nr:30S ribosomal protein S20 [Desulfovibrionaceae bacterium]